MNLNLDINFSTSENNFAEDPRITIQRIVERAIFENFSSHDLEVCIVPEAVAELNQVQYAVTPAEAIMGFIGWLTSRKEKITLSAKHDCVPIIKAIEAFLKVNCFEQPMGNTWTEKMTTPDIVATMKEQQSKLGVRLFVETVTELNFERKEEAEARLVQENAGREERLKQHVADLNGPAGVEEADKF